MRILTIPFIIIVLIWTGLFFNSIHFGIAQSATNFSGIINTDTTWARINSPYTLTGNVLVSNGATLTIEAGTKISLNTHYIMVNGTLLANGNSVNPITFQGGASDKSKIFFTEFSTSWNEQAGFGCIINNAFVNFTDIEINGSPKINNSQIEHSHTEISNGSPVISNNNYFASGIRISDGSPIIFSNELLGGRTVGSEMQYFNPVIVNGGSPIISNNYIHTGETGIEIKQGNPYVYGNNITDCTIGILANAGLIEKNYAANPIKAGNAILRNNTMGIRVIGNSSPTLINNNLSYLYLDASADVDASYNWWGTTNTTEIDQKIYDYNDDFNLGKVDYTPFLTEPNPQAMPDPNLPIPTPIPEQTPTPTPTTPTQNSPPTTSLAQSPTASADQTNTQNTLQLAFYHVVFVVLIIAVITVIVVAIVILRSRQSHKPQP